MIYFGKGGFGGMYIWKKSLDGEGIGFVWEVGESVLGVVCN